MDDTALKLELIKKRYPGLDIVEQLPSGGQKQVYRAKLKGKDLALKLYRPDVVEVRSEREIEAMLRVDSPYVAKVVLYEAFSEGGVVVRCMMDEFVQGKPASYFTDPARLIPIGQMVGITRRLLEGLRSIHQSNIVHRDLKPQNIVLTDDFEPVIIDFGIARLLDCSSVTPSWAQDGPCTPLYASPEVLYYQKRQIDQRSDLYSLGITLYELLTSRHPYKDAFSQEGLIPKKLESPCRYRKELSEDFGFLVQWLSFFERFDRPPSADHALSYLVEKVQDHA